MKKVLESFLFSRHYLVGDGKTYPDAFETVFSLANLFGIRIVEGSALACKRMLLVAGEAMGVDVPRSFYQHFPESVSSLTPQRALFDQFRQYFFSYGLGIESPAGHPALEERFAHLAFRENVELKDFTILSPEEAEAKLRQAVDGLLASSRPLRKDQYQVALAYIKAHSYFPDHCACKDTAIQLILDTGSSAFADFIALPDVIRLSDILQERRNQLMLKNIALWICNGKTRYEDAASANDALRLWKLTEKLKSQHSASCELILSGAGVYHSFPDDLPGLDFLMKFLEETKLPSMTVQTKQEHMELKSFIRKQKNRGKDGRNLNLGHRDKQILGQVLDRKLSHGKPDIAVCCEKQQLWRCLLGHIHYAPKTQTAERFVRALWSGPNQSAYARFEAAMRERQVIQATDVLCREKGPSSLMRHFRFILSRCKSLEEVNYVCDHLGSENLILLIQLLMHYDEYHQFRSQNRVFRFVRMNKMCIHREKEWERLRRKSFLPEELIDELPFMLRKALEKNCDGRFGKVYVDPEIVNIPLPLQEATASGGYGVMPKGTVFHLKKRQIVRAFLYWEGAQDLNISAVALTESGGRVRTFNWQTMYCGPRNSILYSGDQTSGAEGGSEYLDVDIQSTLRQFPEMRYLVIEANLYRLPSWYYDQPSESDEKSPAQKTFDDCECRAGFMQRDRSASGAVFEPKTVQTNFRITGSSTHSYLFAIDLWNCTLIWLNLQPDSDQSVPDASHEFLLPYLKTQRIMNMYDFFCLMADELTDDPMEAELIVSDTAVPCRPDCEVIHSWDTVRVLQLMNLKPS